MQKQKEYINFLVSRKSSVVKTSLIFALIGIIYSLFLNDHFRSTSVIVPTRDNYQSENSSQIGAIAQTIGFGADDATPELKFALSYFNSYKFISEFIVEKDILPEILFFKSYSKRRNVFNYKVNPDDYRMDVLFPDGKVDYSSKYFQEAVKEFREIVTLNPGRENDPAMYLSVIHQSPSFSYMLSKEVLSFLNKSIVDIDIRDSDSKLTYIRSIMSDYDEIEVRRVLSKIVERELTKKILANSLSEYSFMILDPPVLPFKKFSPRRTNLVATFLLTGILLSIIYLTFTFTFRTKEKEHEKI